MYLVDYLLQSADRHPHTQYYTQLRDQYLDECDLQRDREYRLEIEEPQTLKIIEVIFQAKHLYEILSIRTLEDKSPKELLIKTIVAQIWTIIYD